MSHVGSCQVQSMQHRLHYRQHSMQHVNIALFAMPTFWAHHQHHTTLPRRAQCQLLLLTLLICLQKQHTSPVGRQPDKTSHIANIQCSMYVALFAMPVFWAHHQHRTTLPRRAQCQLLLLPLLTDLSVCNITGWPATGSERLQLSRQTPMCCCQPLSTYGQCVSYAAGIEVRTGMEGFSIKFGGVFY